MSPGEATPAVDPPSDGDVSVTGRRSKLLSRILVGVGFVLALVSLLAGYLRWQAFDTPTFRETATKLAEDPEVRARVGSAIATELFERVDLEQDLRERLPTGQQELAAPLAGALRLLGARAAESLLERPAAQKVVVGAMVGVQQVAKRALDDDLGPTDTVDGYIVVDFHPVAVQLAQELSISDAVIQRLPENLGVFRVAQADQFETAQNVSSIFLSIAPWIPWLMLAAFAGAIVLSPRRRRTLGVVATGLTIIGLLVLALRTVAGRVVDDRLTPTGGDGVVARNSWRILTDLLADGAWSVIIVGVGGLLVVWLLSADGYGLRARRALAPVLRARRLAYLAAGVIAVIFVWWEPTAQLGRVLFVLVGCALLAIAAETLHRASLRDV